jgi:hypothetical protein
MLSLEASLEIVLILIILLGGKKMSTNMDNLAAQVAASIAMEQDAIVLINSIPDKVAVALQADSVKIAALEQQIADLNAAIQADDSQKDTLTAQLKTASDALQAAIAAQKV